MTKKIRETIVAHGEMMCVVSCVCVFPVSHYTFLFPLVMMVIRTGPNPAVPSHEPQSCATNTKKLNRQPAP